MIRLTCPECGCIGALSAFLVEGDAKRLVAAVVDLPAVTQRPAMSYIGLFKPEKNALALSKAMRLVQEIAALIGAGRVSRDERTGVWRDTTPEMWAHGIETMLHQRAGLKLPLAGHGYLRSLVYGIADTTAAKAETAQEEQRRTGQHRRQESAPAAETPLQRDLAYINQMLSYGQMSPEEAQAARQRAMHQHGSEP